MQRKTNRPEPVIVILALLLFVAAGNVRPVVAQDKESSLPKLAAAFLGKWQAEGTDADGGKFVSYLNFQWTLDRNFLKVENTINAGGKPFLFATTYYGWQPVMKQIVFWSFDRDGTINEGTATFTDNLLSHQWRSFSQNGEIKDWQSWLKRTSKDEIVFTISDGKRVDGNTVTYKRQK